MHDLVASQWQLSYLILSRVSPVTHSVANCVKRVVVIASSVLFFRTPISPVNALGNFDQLTIFSHPLLLPHLNHLVVLVSNVVMFGLCFMQELVLP
jgi:hypothetical protein